MLYFENGIDSDPVHVDVMTQDAVFEMMIPLIKRILENIELGVNQVLVTFEHDDTEEEEYVLGNGTIGIDIQNKDIRSISPCSNCRFNFYFKNVKDRYTFDGYMNEIFKIKEEKG